MDRLRDEARTVANTGWSLWTELFTSIGVFTAIGFGLDKWFGTEPVLVAVGALIGHAMGIWIAFWRAGQMKAGNERKAGEKA